MEPNVNYTAVGAFVIVLIVAIIISIIYLSSGFGLQHYSTYVVYMKEPVSGLNRDSGVEYNGVIVGAVKQIELNPKNPELVKVLLSVNDKTPITMGTVATLGTRGLTGVTYVALNDKSTDLRPLKALPGQPYPIIPNVPSIFMRLDTALSEITKNVRNVSQSIQDLLDKENRAAFKKMLLGLSEFSENLAANNSHITEFLTNLSSASKEFTPFFQKGTKTVTTLQTQTLPAAYGVLSNINDVSQTLSEVAAELKQNPSVLVRGVDRQALGPGEAR